MSIDQICYEQNFLANVVLRADFSSRPLSLDERVTKFAEGIAKVFPHVSSVPMVELHFEVSNLEGGGGVKHTNVGTRQVFKKTPTGTMQVVLEPTFLALEYGPGDYESFKTFSAEFDLLLDQLYSVFGAFPFDRIGLRYVNEIRLPGKALDWSGIIREELVTGVLAPAVGGRLLRSMHQIVELQGDDQILFNYGIFNPDFPAPAVQRFFILDVDCSRTGVIQKAEAIDCVNQLNSLCVLTFESSIGKGLRNAMRVVQTSEVKNE